MRFDPVTEEEAQQSAKPGWLLKPGQCDFEVKTANLHTKEKIGGEVSESIHLILRLYDANGKEADVHDYLTPAFAHKFRHFAYATGLGHLYEKGEIEPEDCAGRTGRCIVRTKEQRGYEPKNDIADYVIADSTKSTTNYQTSKDKGMGGVALDQAKRAAWEGFKQQYKGDPTMLQTEMRKALEAYFGTAETNTLGVVQWQRFLKDGFKKPGSPIPEEDTFKPDDIPF